MSISEDQDPILNLDQEDILADQNTQILNDATFIQADEVVLGAAHYVEGVYTPNSNGNDISIYTGKILLNGQSITEQELAAIDSNGDGIIDSNDVDYGSLTYWHDANFNGCQDSGEIKDFSLVGLDKIYVEDADLYTAGNAGLVDEDINSQRDAMYYDSYAWQKTTSLYGYNFADNQPLPTSDGTKILGTDGDDYFGADYYDIVIDPSDIEALLGGLGNDVLIASTTGTKLYGNQGDDTLVGQAGNDYLDGDIGNDEIQGGAGDDTIFGFSGDDTIFTGAGNDLVDSGDQNDYISDSGGNDTIYSGNGNDTIFSGSGDNIIYSGIDNDYVSDNGGNDFIAGERGFDTLLGGAGNDTIYGGEDSDTILGGAGNDYIDGGVSHDYMEGGTGDDIYVVNSADDTIYERYDEGHDKVIASFSYQLHADIEDLKVVGTEDSHLTGNKLDNELIGNAGDNVINGVTGADTLIGQDGNDTYLVDSATDVIVERSNEGIDEVEATSSYTLGDNVENIKLRSFSEAQEAIINYQTAWVYGSPIQYELDYAQGDKNIDYQGTCGLTSVANLLTQAGMDVTEEEIVDYAVLHDLTVTDAESSDPAYRGGTTQSEQMQILSDYGVSTTAYNGYNIDGIAQSIKDGHGVLLAVNAGYLWDYPEGVGTGVINHAVTVTGVAYNYDKTQIMGFYICDSGRRDLPDMVRYLSLSDFAEAANVEGAYYIVTDEAVKPWGVDIDATGNDLDNNITGNEGDNVLTGLAGDDTYTINADWGADTIIDSAGVDKIKFTDTAINSSTLNANQVGDDLVITQEGSSNELVLKDHFLSENNKIETVEFYDGSTQTVDSLWMNLVVGTEYDDTLTGSEGKDSVEAGDGHDIVSVGADNDTVFGDLGNDTIDGGDGDDLIYGESCDDSILGGAGNDTLDGGTYNDTIYGEIGADSIIGGVGNDLLDGGIGNDTLDGGYHNDTLLGGEDDDSLFGYYGDDSLNGGTGNDTLDGSYNNDTLDGGDGDDSLVGGTGLDVLLGGAGNDSLYGGDDADSLSGELDNDYLRGEAGNDTLDGGDGHDSLVGGADSDSLIGGAGNDTLLGGTSNDVLIGDSGDDVYVIEASAGNDTISDTLGSDKIKFMDASITVDALEGVQVGNDLIITDTISSNQIIIQDYFVSDDNKVETIEFADNLTLNVQRLLYNEIIGTDGDDSIDGFVDKDSIDGGLGNDTIIDTLGGEDTIIGGSGNDSIVADDGVSDIIDGGIGDDVYKVDTLDVVSDAAGNDTLWVNEQSYTLEYDFIEAFGSTYNGNVSLTGNFDSNTIYLGSGNDTAIGLSGDDHIYVTSGDNYLDGGLGNDKYQISSSTLVNNDTIVDALGNDTIVLDNVGVPITAYQGLRSGDDLVISNTIHSGSITIQDYFMSDSNKVEKINLGGAEDYDISDIVVYQSTGSGLADTISGASNKDSIDGGLGDDVINGGEGEDTLIGGDGNDYIVGGGYEVDSLVGGAGNDVYDVVGSDIVIENPDEGFDVVYTRETIFTMIDNTEYLAATTTEDVYFTGNADGNIIKGNVGNDTITALAGDDSLYGRDGNDILDGGIGNDAYVIESNAGNDTIVDSLGNDKIKYIDASISKDNIGVSQIGNDLIITDTITSGEITIQDYFVSDDNKVETIEFSDGSSVLIHNLLTNIVSGTTSNDTILGENRKDSIDGGLGDDVILGGEGEDTLIGGGGNDYIVGGGNEVDSLVGGIGNDVYDVVGDDTIVENVGEGFDVIYTRNTTYTMADNTEYLASTNTSDVNFTGNADSNIIKGNIANDTITGLAGNDSLYGKDGNDILDGGIGNDAYVIETNAGNDTIVDSLGSDKIVFTDAAISFDDLTGVQSGDDLIITDTISSNQVIVQDYFVSDDNKVETIEFFDGSNELTYNLLTNIVSGTTGNDTILGESRKDSIDGGAGNDTIYGGSGEDTIMGGDGNDYIVGGGYEIDSLVGGAGNDVYDVVGDDTIVENAGEGFDVIYTRNTTYTMADNTEYLAATTTSAVDFTGNADATIIKGNIGNDTITGLGGDDTLYGKAGNDSLDGGIGNDTYVIEANAGNDTIIDSLGADKIKYTNASISKDDLDFVQSGDDLVITDTISSNQVTIQDYFISDDNKVETMEFSDGSTELIVDFLTNITTGTIDNDTISGASNKDSIDGGLGDDVIWGGEGEDTLIGGDGNDYLVGGGYEIDSLVGGAGNDVYDVVGNDIVIENAGEGFDVVYTRETTFTMIDNTEYLASTTAEDVNFTGNADGTIIKGNVGNDTITGLGGDDILYGKAGNDSLDGGVGDDTYVIESNAGNDTIADSLGADKIKYTNALISKDDLEFSQNGNDLVITDTISSNQITIQSYFVSDDNKVEAIEFSDGATEFIAGFLANTITGTSSADTLSGANTKDSIDGGAGNDVIWGGNGEDTLIGGDGNDYLVGGGDEADSLVGGAGNDVYDVLGNDIVVENAGEGFDVVYTRNTTFTMIDNTEYLAATTSEDVNFTGNADGTIIKGNSGNDTINGLGGDDTLYGKAGNDTFEFASGDGQDIVIDSSGADEVQFTDASITSNDVAIYMDGSNNLIINYGAGNQVTIQDQVSNTIERVELNDGRYMSDSDISQLIQDMNQYATDNSLSISNVDDVANNAELMTMIANTWHN